MKVLHICNGAQGNPHVYKFLLQALKKYQVEQSVMIPVWEAPSIDFEDIHCEYFYRDTTILSRLLFRRKIKKLTQFALKKFEVEKFDMIHAHTWFSDGAVAYELFKKFGIPYIIAVRNTDINIFYKYFIHLRKLGIQIVENASQVIFISPIYKNYFENQLLPDKVKNKIFHNIHIIPNGVSSFWLNNRFLKSTISSPVKLLSIGAITPNKNHLRLCGAVDLLRNAGMDVELTIVGKGYNDAPRYLKKLEKFIKEKSYIRLLEKQNREELLITFRAHNIFVLPSHTETFGLVYIEALTQGLPVIYTKGQGIEGYFKPNEIGRLVFSKNINDIANIILSSIQDYATLTENIGQIDLSNFDWEHIAKRYLEIYRR
jgi:glycosyltransferase involved in cell wall biosynthesis